MILNKKIFEYISMHFYGSNLGPPGPRLSWTWGLHTEKLGKGPPDNATYQISSTWVKQFWRRRFLSIFHFWAQDTPPPQGHFGPKGHNLNKLGSGPLGNATYHILKGPRHSNFRGDVWSNCWQHTKHNGRPCIINNRYWMKAIAQP